MVANDAKPEVQDRADQLDHRNDSVDNEKNAADRYNDEGEYVVTWKTCVVWIL